MTPRETPSVTVVLAGPNRVVQCKTIEKDGYKAVQLGFDDQKEQRVTKPLLGHLKKHSTPAVKRLREFRDFRWRSSRATSWGQTSLPKVITWMPLALPKAGVSKEWSSGIISGEAT